MHSTINSNTRKAYLAYKEWFNLLAASSIKVKEIKPASPLIEAHKMNVSSR